ncbi:hypothetical protein HanXRQr2_Chr05g0220461 [Helianthus annuus]|nr:hypothetical protein HanXRQr2_Chr05g0220461 [Helianthus annuus]KAJ0570640.1 hypothetical protein HanHA300_Chr05g0180371 [Helianthus annuus]KAJ0584982.1 hypothetical protein HanHA89_Chr05g0195061 [Helianthus annuus]
MARHEVVRDKHQKCGSGRSVAQIKAGCVACLGRRKGEHNLSRFYLL